MMKIMLAWNDYIGFSEAEVQIGAPSLEASILLCVRYDGASGCWAQIGDVRLREYDGSLRWFKDMESAKLAAEAVLRESLLTALLPLVVQSQHATVKLLVNMNPPGSPAPEDTNKMGSLGLQEFSFEKKPPVETAPSFPANPQGAGFVGAVARVLAEKPVLAVPAPTPRVLYVAASVCKRPDGAWVALLVVMSGETGWLERTQTLEGPEWAHQSVAAQLAAIRMAQKFDHEWSKAPGKGGIPATICNHDRLAVQVANNEVEASAPQLRRVAWWGARPAPERKDGAAVTIFDTWRSLAREVQCVKSECNPARVVALEWAERMSKDASAMPRTLGADELNKILGGLP